MNIEVHDGEEGMHPGGQRPNSLCARVKGFDYDYRAEAWIHENALRHPDAIRFVLLDDHGDRAVWTKAVEGSEVTLVYKTARFQGEWQLNLPWTRENMLRDYPDYTEMR